MFMADINNERYINEVRYLYVYITLYRIKNDNYLIKKVS